MTSRDLLTQYRLLLRLSRVASIDAQDGRERLADVLRDKFRRNRPLRTASHQTVPPEIEAEAVLRFLGKLCSLFIAIFVQCVKH